MRFTLIYLLQLNVKAACPSVGEIVWKKWNVVVDELQSSNSRRLKVGIPTVQNNLPTDWNFRDTTDANFHPHYTGFVMWSRNECGLDFLQAWTDGRLRFDILETYQTGSL